MPEIEPEGTFTRPPEAEWRPRPSPPKRFSLQLALRSIPGLALQFHHVPKHFYSRTAGGQLEMRCPCGRTVLLDRGIRGENAMECGEREGTEGCGRTYIWDGGYVFATGGPRST